MLSAAWTPFPVYPAPLSQVQLMQTLTTQMVPAASLICFSLSTNCFSLPCCPASDTRAHLLFLILAFLVFLSGFSFSCCPQTPSPYFKHSGVTHCIS